MDEWAESHTCLVVGGAGFLGLKIVGILQQAGARVKIIDRVAPPLNVRGVEIFLGDFRDEELLSAALKDVDTVFHTASMIDVRLFPDDTMHKVNVEGTRQLLEACRTHKVSHFVYTSSIDVVFNGKPVADGTEDLPYITDASLCPYGFTKAQAEQHVLAANASAGSLRTVALRPAHIFGPGDPMIAQILTMAAQDQIPCRFGHGNNDYIYVDNAAAAHVQCWRAMLARPTNIAGKAFFINDYNVNLWQHMSIFLASHKMTAPTTFVPVWLVYLMVNLMTFVASVLHRFGIAWQPTLTRYVVLATAQDYYFSSERARRAFNFHSPVSMQEARERTLQWALTLDLKPVAPLCLVHLLHLLYGLVLCAVGTFQFFFPWKCSSLLGLDPSPFPSSSAILSQTVGLIVFVLGSYSVVACFGRWSMSFFQATLWAKLVTGVIVLLQVNADRIPPALNTAAAVEIGIGLLTWALTFDEPATFTTRFDRVTFAQLLHAVSSGIFTAIMMVRPSMILPLVVPDDPTIRHNHSALAWASVMGAAEWMMTWTYTASAFLVELEPFARLSVYSRLGAVLALALGFYFNSVSRAQLMGVLPDGVLALISAWALATVSREAVVRRGKKD